MIGSLPQGEDVSSLGPGEKSLFPERRVHVARVKVGDQDVLSCVECLVLALSCFDVDFPGARRLAVEAHSPS